MSTWTESPAPRFDAPDLRVDENAVRLLLVEDDVGAAGLLADALARFERGFFEVEHAACLADADGRLAGARFDAVVVDLAVLGTGGAAVDALAPFAVRLPVVALTGIEDRLAPPTDRLPDGKREALARIGRADLARIILRAVHRHRRLGVCCAEPVICRIPIP